MKADQVLVEETKNGNKKSFSELVSRHQKTMLRVALRLTRDLELAEDIVQDSFIKAYQKLGLFEGRSSFRSWMFQITINTAKNKIRGKRTEVSDVDTVEMAIGEEAESKLIRENLEVILGAEIEKLPNKQKVALTLRIYEDLSFEEIAQIMECPYDTAKANYRHGLMKLRHRFQESPELNQFKEFDFSKVITVNTRPVEAKP